MTSTTTHRIDADLPGSGPWWRHPMMWLVVGGPGTVVVAAIATLVLAITHPDPVVHASSALDRSGVAAEEVQDAALSPAMKARNHAATGGQAP
ncbi:hypothetical protein [Mitsuaria sp. GD03876]|uniref:hypothetical protein n=1 Tax=Mitsuaria sp. GD03876 TaxID=2975399 RepID=UPI002449142B|nr:hypothetical protein [Mitsuaria sp. GD03876]MDH0866311.1 hypothetical protein [Mitsuaria sp. GD03876]